MDAPPPPPPPSLESTTTDDINQALEEEAFSLSCSGGGRFSFYTLASEGYSAMVEDMLKQEKININKAEE